ncbi:MAG: hypothetical protein GW904_05290, partial [Candidatus Altiarchaeum hamiconexum]
IVSNSTINNSALYNSTANNSIINNSTASVSNISNSTITENSILYNSATINSNLTDSNASNSTASYSAIVNTTILNSQLTNSTSVHSSINNSFTNNSIVNNSSIVSSEISNSATDNSTTTNSNISNSQSGNSNILQSAITNATIQQSNITNSTTTNSNISNSTIQQSTIANSTISHSDISHANISNSLISNSTIQHSNITNSDLSHLNNAGLSNAIVINNSLLSGEIAIGNYAYAVNSSGTYINNIYYSNESQLNLTDDCNSNNECTQFCDLLLHKCMKFSIKEIYPDNGKTFKNDVIINITYEGAIKNITLRLILPDNETKNLTLNVSKNFASVLLSDLINMSNGTYKFEIYTEDIFGHNLSSVRTFTIDSDSIELDYSSETPKDNVTLSGNWIIGVNSSENLSECRVIIMDSNKSIIINKTMNTTNNHFFYYELNVENLSDGVYNYKVIANSAGKEGSAGERQITVDTKPPSAEVKISTGTNSATINISCSEISNATFCYGINNSSNCVNKGFPASPGHLIDIGNLLQNTVYLYNVTFCDKVNNCNSTTGNFTTKATDTTKPKILNASTDTTNRSVLIKINFSEESNITLRYGINFSNLQQEFSNLSFASVHSVNLSNLNKGTTYYYNLTFCDESGNCNSTTGNFTTKKSLDDSCSNTDECYNLKCLSNKCSPLEWECRENINCGSGKYCDVSSHTCKTSGTSDTSDRSGRGSSGTTTSYTGTIVYNYCGDGKCDPGENCSTCPQDCGKCIICGDGICDKNETYINCPQDCKKPLICGDKICEGNETCENCQIDCGKCIICGDGICDKNETYINCPQDCKKPLICGDKICEGNETCENCQIDCGKCAINLIVPSKLKEGEKFTVKVTTKDGKPVENAIVKYGNITVHTNLNGEAEFVALKNAYNILVNKENYEEVERILNIEEKPQDYLILILGLIILVILLFLILWAIKKKEKEGKEEEKKEEKEQQETIKKAEEGGLIGLSIRKETKEHPKEECLGGLIGLQ